MARAGSISLLLWVLLASLILPACADVNRTLEDTAPQITYSPALCNATVTPTAPAANSSCVSAWQTTQVAGASNGTVTSTSGPNDGSGGFIPQVFFTVKALSLIIATSPNSTALVNVTVSEPNPPIAVSATFNASIEFIYVVGLSEDRPTTVTLTFFESTDPTVLALDSILLTLSDHNTDPFATRSLPIPTPFPTNTPRIIFPAPLSSEGTFSGHLKSGDKAAIALGVILGVVVVCSGAYVVFRRYHRRKFSPSDSQES